MKKVQMTEDFIKEYLKLLNSVSTSNKVNPTKPKRYFRNRIKCKKCGDIIESKTRHDFVQCSCKSCFVDGGHDYRRIGGNLKDIEDLGEWVENVV